MNRSLLVVLLSFAAACSSGFDAKRQVDVLDSRVGPAQAASEGAPSSDDPDVARTKLSRQLFVVVPVASDVDPFPRRPKVSLPASAKLEHAARGSAHQLTIKTAQPFEEFDREVAPLVSDAAALPKGTALLFHWTPAGYAAVPLRMPPLATTQDIAAAMAEVHETRIAGADGRRSRPVIAPAVRVTLTPDATTRIARSGAGSRDRALAAVVRGRIMKVGALEDPSTVFLDFDWLTDEEKRSAAVALAGDLRAEAGK